MNAHVIAFHLNNAVRYTDAAQFLGHSERYYINLAIGALQAADREMEGAA